MRAIASGIFLSKANGRHAIIHWNNTLGLKADFQQLFQSKFPSDVSLVENRRWIYNIGNTREYLLHRPFLALKHHVFYNYNRYEKGLFSDSHQLEQGKSYLFVGCHSIDQHYCLKELFVPTHDIQERIDQITKDFSINTIGVHIRRSDNVESIKRSPLSSFIELLSKEIEKDKMVKFYLASDDDDTKKKLNAQFPGRIITNYDPVTRNSLEGMKFAVVDLYCLSRTKKIIGSDYSSYSFIAAEIGGIKIEYA